MLTIILVVLLIAFLAGGGFGYSRWGLGGMSPADIADVRAHGGQGVAAIRGLWPSAP